MLCIWILKYCFKFFKYFSFSNASLEEAVLEMPALAFWILYHGITKVSTTHQFVFHIFLFFHVGESIWSFYGYMCQDSRLRSLWKGFLNRVWTNPNSSPHSALSIRREGDKNKFADLAQGFLVNKLWLLLQFVWPLHKFYN